MSDATARLAALDIGRHVLLQAPAGSGKTTVLTQRFLHALAAVDEPEQVLAITFTRKAAAEMRERVLLALEDGIRADHPDRNAWSVACGKVRAQAERRGWDLVELPQRLRIQTIDSLAHEIARTMPLLGRMQTSLAVVDDGGPMYRAAARLTLQEGEGDPVMRPHVERLLERLDNNVDQAQQLLAELLPGRNRWLPWLLNHPDDELADRVAASIERIVASELSQAYGLMPADWWEQAAHLARAAAGHRLAAGDQKAGAWRCWLAAETRLAAEPGNLEAWKAIADLLLKADGDPRSTVNKTQGFPTTDRPLKEQWQGWMDVAMQRPAIFSLLRAISHLPPPLLDADERAALASLARIMVLAAAELKVVFSDRGLVDHGEIAAIARQALASLDGPGEDTLRHTLRISHLLVDEFQDTSPDQLELVDALTRGWQEGDGRSLFFVGDPMQAIYLFRNSEVGLFLQVRAGGVGGIRLESMQLTRNFRSQKSLVDWSNQSFARIFPALEDLRSSAVTFLPGDAASPPDQRLGAAVQIWPLADADADIEARAIADEIAALRARDTALRIAVLVQTRALAGPVLQALRRLAVPVTGVDLATLAERPVVRDLVALGQALLDAGNRTAWLAVLRSPVCGLTLADLLHLCEAAGPGPLVDWLQQPESIANLSGDALLRLQRVGPLLHQAWRMRGARRIADHMDDCWHRLGGAAACRNAAELATARQYLLALRALQEREGQVSPERLAELAARLLDRGEAEGENSVEVLTIHRAKGLEWDVVFVPGLGRRTGNDPSPLLRALELPAPDGGSDLLLAVRSLGRPNTSDPLARYIRKLQAERLDNERRRLLYVAATRARFRLYLSGHVVPDRNGQPRAPAGSLLEHLWPAVRVDFEQVNLDPVQPAPAPLPLPMVWWRLPAAFELQPLPSPPAVECLTPALAAEEGELQVEFSWVGPLARAAGTVMHAELERLAILGEAGLVDVAGRVHACTASLREHGIGPDMAPRTAQGIISRLQELPGESTARWLLFTPHQDAAAELRLSGIVDGQLRNAVIDRSFVDAEGTRWIVDYKTGVHAGGGLEEFMDRELQRYAPQLRLYRALAGGLGPEPVRAGLYFPWQGEFRELPD